MVGVQVLPVEGAQWFVAGTCIVNVTESTIIGDVNKDGIVNSTDIGILIDCFQGRDDLSKYSFKNADANQDGLVNWYDVNYLINNVVHLGFSTTKFPGNYGAMTVGQRDNFIRVVTPASEASNSYCKLVWTSSNPAVATVDSNGYVTAVSAGKASITSSILNGYYSSGSQVIVS